MKLLCEVCRKPITNDGRKIPRTANRNFCCEDHKRQFEEAHEKYFGKPTGYNVSVLARTIGR